MTHFRIVNNHLESQKDFIASKFFSMDDIFISGNTKKLKSIEKKLHNEWYTYFSNHSWNSQNIREIFQVLNLICLKNGYILDTYVRREKLRLNTSSYFYSENVFYMRKDCAERRRFFKVRRFFKAILSLFNQQANNPYLDLSKFRISFDKEGILQFFYLMNILDNKKGDMFLSQDDFLEYVNSGFSSIYPDSTYQALCKDFQYLPKIKINDNIAEFLLYGEFNRGCTGGLIKQCYGKFIKKGESIDILEYEEKQIGEAGHLHLEIF